MNRKRFESRKEDRKAWAECFLLCDFARVEGGKLYVVGGGWNEIAPRQLPLDFKAYLGTKLIFRWDRATAKASIRIELTDMDGRVLGDPIEETTIEGDPDPREDLGALYATVFMGTEVNLSLAEPGLFILRLVVNELEVAATRFRVKRPQGDMA